MSSPAPGPERAVADREEGWAADLSWASDLPPDTSTLEEPLLRTLWRVVASPRAAMVGLGRDPRAAQKGLATVLLLGVPVTLAQLVLWQQGYPPAELAFGSHALQVALTVPLTLVGLALAAFVIGLAVPAEHDRRWGPIFGRLGVTSVTMVGTLFTSLAAALILGLGLVEPEVWWNESAAVYWAELAFGLWSFALLLVVVRVSTHRSWLAVVPLTVGVLLVMAAPYFPLWVLG